MIAIYFLVAAAFTIHWLRSGETTYSMSYYALPDNRKFLFTLYCWGIAIPGMAIFGSPWIAVGAAGIIIVGVASDFVVNEVYEYILPDGSVEERERRVKGIVWWMHMIGTFVGIGFFQFGIWVSHGLWYMVVLFAISSILILLLAGRRNLGWIEFVTLIIVLVSGLIVNYG